MPQNVSHGKIHYFFCYACIFLRNCTYLNQGTRVITDTKESEARLLLCIKNPFPTFSDNCDINSMILQNSFSVRASQAFEIRIIDRNLDPLAFLLLFEVNFHRSSHIVYTSPHFQPKVVTNGCACHFCIIFLLPIFFRISHLCNCEIVERTENFKGPLSETLESQGGL